MPNYFKFNKKAKKLQSVRINLHVPKAKNFCRAIGVIKKQEQKQSCFLKYGYIGLNSYLLTIRFFLFQPATIFHITQLFF